MADNSTADRDAPGSPGIGPTWTSSAKDIIGTSLGSSRIWFTVGYGIVNEIYYPRVDLPQIRDLGFIVADSKGFWCEIKRLNAYTVTTPAPGVPAPCIVHKHERFTLTLRVVVEPDRDALMIEVVLDGDEDLRPYVLLAPHLGGSGSENMAATGQHYCRNVLWAEQGPFAVALAAVNEQQQDALGRRSAGYVGASDGWQDFDRNGAMSWTYERAGPGNVALLGELQRHCVVALGFGSSRGAAASLAVAALAQPFEQIWSAYCGSWRAWHARCDHATQNIALPPELAAQFAISRMVLRAHMDETQPGATVASLSVPWGNTTDTVGGYHLVWPRDMVECGTALLGAGAVEEARQMLRYLIATQHADGHWNQNQWLGGTPFWQGIQLDEAAMPVLLAALLDDHDAANGIEVIDMTRRALSFVVRTGPVTDQDRWEEDRGINAFTLAVCIAALVAGAAWLSPAERELVLDVADDWNARIEQWLYAEDSALARQVGVSGHFIRMATADVITDRAALREKLAIKNRSPDPGLGADCQISTDFLQLVRFALRSPRAATVRNSLAAVDALLQLQHPKELAWHRYNEDGYGEHDDGRAYDGTGVGRAWPLLTGERGHHALLNGEDALPYLTAMCTMSGHAGMLPEQIWDSVSIEGKRLQRGKPTGSAMPLAWSHAEFIKLALSRHRRESYDCPRAVQQRYAAKVPTPPRSVWSEAAPVPHFFAGSALRINLDQPAVIYWRIADSKDWQRAETQACLPQLWTTVVPTQDMASGTRLQFCWQSPAATSTGSIREVIAS